MKYAVLALVAFAIVGCTAAPTNDPEDSGRRTDAWSPTRDASTPPGTDAHVDVGTPGDTGTTAVDTGAAAGSVPIFVAQGLMGRTTISCDDGHTWIANRAWDAEGDPHLCDTTGPVVCQTGRCGSVWYDGSCTTSSPCECGDSSGSAKGVVFGDGWFVATFGWGAPGAVWRSRDGVRWEETLTHDQFGGIAFGAGRFVLASREPRHGDGATWTAPGLADFRGSDGAEVWSVRRFAFSDYGGGRFVAVASGNVGRDLLVSADGGDTWRRPGVLPDACAQSVSTYGGIVSGNGVILIVDQAANACRSTDGGDTWSVTSISSSDIYSHGVWTGTEFWFWGSDGRRHESTDGATWTSTPMVTPIRIGPVALGDSGTLVGVVNVYDGYADQVFIRSADGGLTWEELAPPAFEASHPIFYMTFGRGQASALCPAR